MPNNKSQAGATRHDRMITLTVRRSHLFGVLGFVLGVLSTVVVGNLNRNGAEVGLPQALNAAEPPYDAFAQQPVDVDIEDRPFTGPIDAPVTIVEFTDYQCPFCQQHHRMLPALLDQYGDQVQYVVRNFPISSIHPHAMKAAEAAECALDQDLFWPYRDKLFAAETLDQDNLIEIANELDMDKEKFETCLTSGVKTDVVNRDLTDGVRYGVTGTPSFFINGNPVEGALTLDAFAYAITNAIDEQ